MGLADRDAQAGRRELEITEGSKLEFRGASIIAIVNFPEQEVLLNRGELDLDQRMVSDIEVENCRVTPPPSAGEAFKDSKGRFHRIQRVRSLDSVWHCTCNVEYPERAFKR